MSKPEVTVRGTGDLHEEETLRGTRNKREHILFWATSDGAVIIDHSTQVLKSKDKKC